MTDEPAIAVAARYFGVPVTEFVEPLDRFEQGDELRLHYLDWGTEGLPPLVFLHGGGQNAHTWDLVTLTLRLDYHVLSVDLPGHGDSAWSETGEYTPQATAREVAGLFLRIGLERFVLAGMSMGGSTSIAYARDHHDTTLAALIIVDVGPEIRPEGVNQVRTIMQSQMDVEYDSIDQAIDVTRTHNPQRPREVSASRMPHNLRQLPSGKWIWKYDSRFRHRNAQRSPESNRVPNRLELWDDVRKISCPALVLRGERSKVLHAEDAQRLAGSLPRGEWVEVPGAGHSVQTDNPAALAAEIRRFLLKIGY